MMLALLASLILFPAEETESVMALLEKARPANPKEVRIEAIGDLEKAHIKNPEQVCRLLEQYVGEEDVEIRSAALISLGLIASGAKMECPLAIVEAIDDKDEGIRSNTQGLVYMFERFPAEATPLIFKAADSEETDLRDFAGIALPRVAGKTPEVIKKLETLMNDPNEFVRHSAHIGHHNATKDFEAFLTFLLDFSSDLNPPHPLETEQQRKDQLRRNLNRLGAGVVFYNAARERPKELVKILLTNLSHKEPTVRQAALRQLRAMAIISHESYRAIPKAKALAEVAKLFEDQNEKVREWARKAHQALEEGPPPEAPESLESFEKFDPLKRVFEHVQDQKPQAGEMP
jgi:HEAT repeat protein